MAQQVMELKTDKTTAEIKRLGLNGGDETLDIRPPLTLAGWNLVEAAAEMPGVVVTSADGDVFIGQVTDVDEDRYVITVELS